MFVSVEDNRIFKAVPGPVSSVRWIRDGDGPPDEAWLRSVGFVTAANDYWVWAKKDKIIIAFNVNDGGFQLADESDNESHYESDRVNLKLDTKFQVRCLCLALGITLDEAE